MPPHPSHRPGISERLGTSLRETVDGLLTSLETKHTLLWEKYRSRP